MVGLPACVSSGADVHLAPLYSRVSSAGGGTSEEALFGMWIADREAVGGPIDSWAVRPFGGWRREPDGPAGETPGANAKWRAELLHPLGRITSGVRTSSSWFLPLYSWRSRETAGGGRRWTLVSLPGVWLAKEDQRWASVAWFPIGGHVEDFLTYDAVDFVLFPLWSTAKRDGKDSTHFLYPVLGWTRGGGETSFHLWPLWVHGEVEGFYERDSYLWPLVHIQTNGLHRGADQVERRWMVWPLIGSMTRGTYRSWTFLWPLFGYARDRRTDFRAVDAPWPLVRIQSGGENPRAEERFRIWPFYSHFKGYRLESWSVLWPLAQRRIERAPDAERRSIYAFPFWQSWRKRDASGNRSSWQKLWPLYQRRDTGGRERVSVLAPYPFHWDERFDFYWAWPFELWTEEAEPAAGVTRERAWGGLWRRERDAFEDRRSFTGLWARRTYRENGRRVHETSLLFGLLRWRSMEDGDADVLAPAFPGPGWPARRTDELLCRPDDAALEGDTTTTATP
jgi:hypothetical protein